MRPDLVCASAYLIGRWAKIGRRRVAVCSSATANFFSCLSRSARRRCEVSSRRCCEVSSRRCCEAASGAAVKSATYLQGALVGA